jgi:mono/diheme cytochrome c family protein
VIYSGLPDVAATTPHAAVTEWVLSTTMVRSVRRRARGVSVPDDLGDPARARRGASAYDAMCAGCHARPGSEPSVVARGLLPEPPRLDEAGEWSEAELFWIVQNGVRMTGMPAFGPTHSDAELWDLVALLRQLPTLSPPEYRALLDASREHEHRHAH